MSLSEQVLWEENRYLIRLFTVAAVKLFLGSFDPSHFCKLHVVKVSCSPYVY